MAGGGGGKFVTFHSVIYLVITIDLVTVLCLNLVLILFIFVFLHKLVMTDTVRWVQTTR